ncbi:MAG: family 10 glycosylhydrolase [Clostridia bacterium]|nr:family 10 glycosylhydrolase [Clostridia bacterium]
MKKKDYVPFNPPYMKAMWLSQFDLTHVYLKDGIQREKAGFSEIVTRIINDVKEAGFNTVIVQTRPNADSLYPSAVYPASVYCTGKYGRTLTYDPFEIIVDAAHSAGLSVHAWINPMRCMTDDEIGLVGDGFAVGKWYADEKTHGKQLSSVSGRWYLNPAYAEARLLINEGAAELLDRYDLDGLHMDDYFYPTTDEAFDAAAYSEYVTNGGSLSLPDFRREMLDRLIAGLYATVKSRGNDIKFGISPAGNIGTVYEKQYADVYRWCRENGRIDYLTPQVYFGLEHETFDFVTVCDTFRSIIKNPSVSFTVGMTFGKAKSKFDPYAGNGKYEWAKHRDIMRRCLEHVLNDSSCSGIAVFCYSYFRDPVTGKRVEETLEEADGFCELLSTVG